MGNITNLLTWFDTKYIINSPKQKWSDYMMSVVLEEIIRKQNITTETLWDMINDIQNNEFRNKFDAYIQTVKSYENKIIEALFGDNKTNETLWTIDFNWETIDQKTKTLLWYVWNYLPQEGTLLSKINEILSSKKERKNKYKLIINIDKSTKWRNYIKNIYMLLMS